MSTWPEARAAKVQRLERAARHYTPDLLGPPCTVCRERLVLALADRGEQTHPMCASLERGRRR